MPTRAVRKRLSPLPLHLVRIQGGLWADRIQVNREKTIPHIYRACRDTGRIEAWKLAVGPGRPDGPCRQFWDSDLAKWLEAAAHTLAAFPDPALEKRVDHIVDLIAAAQQRDGYLNTYFPVFAPADRWTNLRDMHELYCTGHLIEAAVAYYQATGKRKFLDVVSRCADHIDRLFGPDKTKQRGYPGHEEIELALVKLHRATGEGRYLDLARYFIDERGRAPSYFLLEARARGEPRPPRGAALDYYQAHTPVRRQPTAEGHAVRALYLYSAMADLAAETGDPTLLHACRRLWRSVTRKRMYLTGGIGSSRRGERFTFDYDLPNEASYAETCANIALVLWAHRMLQIEDNGEYADVMERALYNGVLSGLSLDGTRFFYANRHALYPGPRGPADGGFPMARRKWFDCPCCPPNIARLLASFPHYVYSQSPTQLSVHLYTDSAAQATLRGQPVTLHQRTDYPWKDKVRITLRPPRPLAFTLALRIPAWCRRPRLQINGRGVSPSSLTRKGYARIKRTWQPGDRVDLTLPMPIERIEADPRVRMNAGRVALQRGPIVYCLEETDNGPDLNALMLPASAPLRARFDPRLLGGTVVIAGLARRTTLRRWRGALYRPRGSETKRAPIKAIPYYLWANRKVGEMLVWIRRC